MSDTDSFIEEVTEEVRRDRLFAYIRRYAWIAIALVVLIVGGAAYNEYRKAQINAAAEATGDAIFAAVALNDDAERIAALQALDANSGDAALIVDFLLASHQIVDGQNAEGANTLDLIANSSDSDMPEIYRQIAMFKAVTARGSDLAVADRRRVLETLAIAGSPLALLAQEQLALADVEEGNADAAITRLQTIIIDSGVTPGLRRRATQLIVALGGAPQALATGQAVTE